MKPFVAALIWSLAGTGWQPAAAADPLPPVPAGLEQQLDALDATDAELSTLQAQLDKAPQSAQAAQWRARIAEIEAYQEALLRAIAQAVGQPPPATAPAPAATPARAPPLEEHVEAQQRKDEALRDRNILRE